jgi:hypothetical protein
MSGFRNFGTIQASGSATSSETTLSTAVFSQLQILMQRGKIINETAIHQTQTDFFMNTT